MSERTTGAESRSEWLVSAPGSSPGGLEKFLAVPRRLVLAVDLCRVLVYRAGTSEDEGVTKGAGGSTPHCDECLCIHCPTSIRSVFGSLSFEVGTPVEPGQEANQAKSVPTSKLKSPHTRDQHSQSVGSSSFVEGSPFLDRDSRLSKRAAPPLCGCSLSGLWAPARTVHLDSPGTDRSEP